MDSDELVPLVDAVVAVFPTYPRMKIEADIAVTGDANATIERILDGTFLAGSRLDPRRFSGGRGASEARGAMSGSDSGDGGSPGSGRPIPPLPRSPAQRRSVGRPSYAVDGSSSAESELEDPSKLLARPTKSNAQPAKPKTAAPKPSKASKTAPPAQRLVVPPVSTLLSGSSDVEIIDEPVVAFKSQAPKPSAASAPAAVYNLDTDSEAAEPVSSAPNVRKAAGGTIESSSSPAQPRPRFTYNFQPIVEDILSRKKAVSDDEDDFDGSSPPKKKRAPAKPRAKEKSTDESSDEEPAPKPRKRAPKDPARAAAQEAEKARKAAERERKKAKREEQKREDQARKEEVKRVRQVNRVMNKKEASKDMIVDVDVGIVNKPGGGALLENLRLQDCQVSVQSHPIPDTILWRRRTRALWDGEKDAWIPLDEERIIPENFMVIIMAAEEFGRRIRANSISTHLAEIRSTFSGRSVILLVTGLRDYRRRLDSKTSSGYREGVLQQVYGVAGNAANQQQQRGATVIIGGQVVSVADLPPKAEVDQELMRLQIMEKIRIIEAEDNEEAIDFMIGLTTEIAMIPFKAIRENLLDFCPDGKLRKSGTDGADTWQWMLRQIHMLEENSANAVVKEYPTLNSLFQAYSRCTSKGQAERLLEDIVVQRHGKAGETNRRLGPALSKRIYNVIMGEDPEESAR